jgi:hypothetical protein
MNPAAINKVFNESDESEKDKHKIKSRHTHIFSHLPKRPAGDPTPIKLGTRYFNSCMLLRTFEY